MEKRHQDLLTARLEDAFLNGVSHLTWDEIYHWYNVEKIAARTRRDLEARWQDVSSNKWGRLQQVESRGGIFIFGESAVKYVDA